MSKFKFKKYPLNSQYIKYDIVAKKTSTPDT